MASSTPEMSTETRHADQDFSTPSPPEPTPSTPSPVQPRLPTLPSGEYLLDGALSNLKLD